MVFEQNHITEARLVAILKNERHVEFFMASTFFWKGDLWGTFLPKLISQFAWWFAQSAPLYTFLTTISQMHQLECSQSAGCHKCNETPPTQYRWSRLSDFLSVTVIFVIIYIHTYLMSWRITWDLHQSFQGLHKNLWKKSMFWFGKTF